MKEKLFKTIELKNNHVINFYDLSKTISTDSWLIKIIFRMEVLVDKSLFSKASGFTEIPENFNDIKQKVGKKVVYEVIKERNFILNQDKDEVFEQIQNNFINISLEYLSKPNFPAKLILKKFNE